jgi:hypothetical protein
MRRISNALVRRAAALFLSLVAVLGMGLATSSAAHADGALPDCIHGLQPGRTGLQTYLPVNDYRTDGTSDEQWLYWWDGYSWRYTGHYVGAHSYSGTWMSGGYMVNNLAFYLRPGSGSYIVKERISRAGQQPFVFWQPLYRNLPGNRWAHWCTA